jgi:putative colanic acid biosynthesis acetyltransferase WcaF
VTVLDARKASPMTGGASFTIGNRIERVLWQAAWLLLARWTPPMASPWRILLLKLFGARIGAGAAIAASVKVWLPRHLELGDCCSLAPGVDCYNMGPIRIGRRSIISQGAYLCAGSHDVADPDFQLITRPIRIGDDVWIAAQAFVAPGVEVADGAVLAARGCAFGPLRPWTIYRGNPATAVRSRIWRDRA